MHLLVSPEFNPNEISYDVNEALYELVARIIAEHGDPFEILAALEEETGESIWQEKETPM